MRVLLFLIRKEFIQIFRNKVLSRAILMVPLVQMLILVPAITFEIKNVRLTVTDNDKSINSRAMISDIQGSGFFIITGINKYEDEGNELIRRDKADVHLIIPPDFSKALGRGETTSLLAGVNAINATSAQLAWSYLSGVIRDYNRDLMLVSIPPELKTSGGSISISTRYWYNEHLSYEFYMLPGILVILITAIGFLLAGLNMVREKETGTLEQINVTPVHKFQLVFAKVIPFLLIGLFDLAMGLGVGWVVYRIPFEGSIMLLFGASAIFLMAVLGLALFFSTFSSTQQQYMFLAFFFTMIFILMSGIFTPYESMPRWAQTFNYLNPVFYLMKINRMVMLKGSGISDIITELSALLGLAILFGTLAVGRYRKRT